MTSETETKRENICFCFFSKHETGITIHYANDKNKTNKLESQSNDWDTEEQYPNHKQLWINGRYNNKFYDWNDQMRIVKSNLFGTWNYASDYDWTWRRLKLNLLLLDYNWKLHNSINVINDSNWLSLDIRSFVNSITFFSFRQLDTVHNVHWLTLSKPLQSQFFFYFSLYIYLFKVIYVPLFLSTHINVFVIAINSNNKEKNNDNKKKWIGP